MSNRRKPSGDYSLHDGQVIIDGQFVSQRVSQVVEAIKEYDPRLEVQWIPASAREADYPAFRILYNQPGMEPYFLFHVMTEEEFDERVLQRVIANDQSRGKHLLSEYEQWEEAAARVKHQEWLDALEEAQDVAKHVLATRKGKYKVNNDLIIDDTKPFNVAHLDERTGLPKKGSPGYAG